MFSETLNLGKHQVRKGADNIPFTLPCLHGKVAYRVWEGDKVFPFLNPLSRK